MNPYTATWTGVAAGDGPQTVHIVQVDNGCTRALADPVGRQALRCIRCSACLNFCPVYERTGGHAYGSVYPGPIGAILNPLLNGGDAGPVEKSLPYASSLCGRCFEVCPVRIDIPTSWCTYAAKSSTRPASARCRLSRCSGCALPGGRSTGPAGWALCSGSPAWAGGCWATASGPLVDWAPSRSARR